MDDMRKILFDQIAALFVEAGRAHHEAFAAVDGADPDWPIWYAEYLQIPLSNLLNANFTRSELTFLFVYMNKLQAIEAPGSQWTQFYAHYLVKHYIFG